MGISLEVVNFNELFHTHGKHRKLIINDFSEGSEQEKEALNRLIYTKDTTGLLSNLASCECGKITGEHKVDVECEICHIKVRPAIEHELESFVWVRKPIGVEALINPIVWTILNEHFTKSGFEILRWLCDTHYQPPVRMPLIMDSVLALGFDRGYNNFVKNFDAIMEALFNLKGLRVKRGTEDPWYKFVQQYRDRIFSDYIPLINRSLLVIEQTTVGTYVDPVVTGAVDAIRMMASIDDPMSNFSVRMKEHRTIKSISALAEYYDGLYRTMLAKKEGIFRKHVFGTRSHFSFRAVISSITAPHNYDELHIPWGVGVSCLQMHLTSKLIKNYSYTPNQAKELLNAYAMTYHPLLDQLFKELITEAPFMGIPCIFQRNPSLERGSAQALYVTKVKTDPNDPTVSLSILIVVGYNADFDGDQLNGTLSLDNWTARELMALAPHKSAFSLNAPWEVSKNISMPKPAISTFASWMHSPDAILIVPEKLQTMEALGLFD